MPLFAWFHMRIFYVFMTLFMGVLLPYQSYAQSLSVGKEYRIEIVRVSDGDTFHARILRPRWAFWQGESQTIRIRPDDYDSAESRDPSRDISALEKEAGRRAAVALRRILYQETRSTWLGRKYQALLSFVRGGIRFTWSGKKHRDRYIGRVRVNGTDLGMLMVRDGLNDQRENKRPTHSIPWIYGQTRRLEWFPDKR